MDESLYHEFYEVERSHWWFQARREILYTLALQFLAPKSKLLDIGCGTGYFLEKAQEAFQVWGVDASPIAVGMCQKRGLIGVSQGSPENLSAVQGNTFDAVTFFDVIEHLDDDLGALLRAKDLLSSKGLCLITVPAYQWMWSKHDDLNHHKRRYTKPQLARVILNAGFGIKKISYFNSYLFPLAAAVRTIKKILNMQEGNEFAIPSPFVNNSLKSIFQSELSVLKTSSLTFPFGLSIIAIAEKK
ncbi:MAG: class I SAM-dependent methyltransferase [Chloroherpetonaceae bacterium]|nr:class I SAM-dependent methyltransferase [Chloroherpetonaceae bacterium]